MRRRYTSEQRSALIDLVTAGQATVSEAATRLGVTASTAYYWVNQAGSEPRRKGAKQRAPSRRRRQVDAPTFVRLVRTGDLDARSS
jgi:transposase-like protein